MADILVLYYSRRGATEALAREICHGIDGVARFDGETWTVYDRDSGVSDVVSYILETRSADGASTIWAGTNDGLVQITRDAGKTWNPRIGDDTDGVRTDAGVGLLFDLSRLSLSNILRLEVAWPDDSTGPVVTLTGSALF